VDSPASAGGGRRASPSLRAEGLGFGFGFVEQWELTETGRVAAAFYVRGAQSKD
jgi:hypothetical protein